jgi:hypothetical protein
LPRKFLCKLDLAALKIEMRIPVEMRCEEGKLEWSIVELQGELISKTKASLSLGQLEYKKVAMKER